MCTDLACCSPVGIERAQYLPEPSPGSPRYRVLQQGSQSGRGLGPELLTSKSMPDPFPYPGPMCSVRCELLGTAQCIHPSGPDVSNELQVVVRPYLNVHIFRFSSTPR